MLMSKVVHGTSPWESSNTEYKRFCQAYLEYINKIIAIMSGYWGISHFDAESVLFNTNAMLRGTAAKQTKW